MKNMVMKFVCDKKVYNKETLTYFQNFASLILNRDFLRDASSGPSSYWFKYLRLHAGILRLSRLFQYHAAG